MKLIVDHSPYRVTSSVEECYRLTQLLRRSEASLDDERPIGYARTQGVLTLEDGSKYDVVVGEQPNYTNVVVTNAVPIHVHTLQVGKEERGPHYCEFLTQELQQGYAYLIEGRTCDPRYNAIYDLGGVTYLVKIVKR